MNLTNDDLQAIQQIVQTTVQPMIDDLVNDTAAGFAEVHEKFAEVDKRFEQIGEKIDNMQADLHRIDNKLDATIDKTDDHAIRLARFETKAA